MIVQKISGQFWKENPIDVMIKNLESKKKTSNRTKDSKMSKELLKQIEKGGLL